MNISKNSHTILMITHVVPYPPAAGNEIRILNLLRYFKREGWRIIVLFRDSRIDNDVKDRLKEIIDHIYLPECFSR